MLEKLAIEQLRALADMADAVREVRDRMLTGVRDEAFVEAQPARGRHNPTADLGLDVVPANEPARLALETALAALPPAALRELWSVVLIGRGDYGVKDWQRAVAEASRLADIDPSLFMGLADLHGYLMKAVTELERM